MEGWSWRPIRLALALDDRPPSITVELDENGQLLPLLRTVDETESRCNPSHPVQTKP